ncbi:MAG TPA: nucleotide exchange factor GrpE [Solirubrobacteraceae bacterium]
MSESKQTIPVNGKADAAEEQSSAAEAAPEAETSAPEAETSAPEAEAAAPEAELQGDLDELGKLAAKRDEYLALAQRTQADFENYRKRVARESALAQERGVAKLAKELLPAIDNLERAIVEIALATGETDKDPLLGGVRLVLSELTAALARVGVESFSPAGETFDPSLHEAMATVPQPPEGGAPSGAVVEVYQPGYRLGESIIRPARVVVAA